MSDLRTLALGEDSPPVSWWPWTRVDHVVWWCWRAGILRSLVSLPPIDVYIPLLPPWLPVHPTTWLNSPRPTYYSLDPYSLYRDEGHAHLLTFWDPPCSIHAGFLSHLPPAPWQPDQLRRSPTTTSVVPTAHIISEANLTFQRPTVP